MGFLDKVKEQAAVAGAAAKDAAQKGQSKLDDIQAKRAADALLRDLGVAVYAERTGRGTPALSAQAQRVEAALGEHETAHGAILLVMESPVGASPGGPGGSAPPQPPSSPPAPPPPPV